MTQALTIFGLASEKVVKIIPISGTIALDLSLMNFLISNGITIASSCGGVGGCHKCLINRTQISCQVSLIEFLKLNPSGRVEISYL